MKILILCDRESSSFNGENLQSHVQTTVEKSNNETQIITLNGDEIKPCIGCFGCWVKTPGQCVMTKDTANKVAGEEIQSDVLILLSKINYGTYSYDIKSFLDRSIQNLLPFFEIIEGEMRHKMRYGHFPVIISIGYGDCSPEERETFITLAKHNALNMRPPKHFVLFVESIDEIDETIESLDNVLNLEVEKCLKQ